MTTKKRATFDTEFMRMNTDYYKEQCASGEFDHYIMTYFTSIQQLISGITGTRPTLNPLLAYIQSLTSAVRH